MIQTRALRRFCDFMQHPAVAPILFTGLLYFWLIPLVHTRAMLDANLHDAMDWSIAISAIVFWSLILDSRPKPPASLSYRMRAALILLVLLPQIALGAILWTTAADVYPIYAICGRIFAMTALDDQQYGGLIIMLPSAVMSVAAMFIVASRTAR
jgi:putative membrane protein